MARSEPIRAPLAGAASLLLALSLGACGDGGSGEGSGRAAGRGARSAAGRPSVILISIDTLRQDHVGHYGYERETTPFLDTLAEESLVFDQAYTTMSWTLIAHMSMLTGFWPQQHKVWTGDAALPEAIPTLAERLREEGYATLGFYKSPGWLEPRHGYDRGFDLYQPHAEIQEAEEHVFAALAELPDDQPVFLFVHLFDVHNPPYDDPKTLVYDPPAPYDAMFVPDARARLEGTNSKRLWFHDASELTPEQHEAVVALYDGGIRYVDDELARWFARWRESGLLGEALTIVTSDHGEGLCERGGGYGGHGGTSQAGLLVPLLIRFPDARFGGTRIPDPVSLVDLVPTALDYLKLPLDPRLVGHSLLKGRPEGSLILAERDQVRALIRYPIKVVENQKADPGRVYDLLADPEEKRPVRPNRDMEEYRRLVDPLHEAFESESRHWYYPGEEGRGRALTSQELADLAALGYAGEDVEGAEDGEGEAGDGEAQGSGADGAAGGSDD